MTNAQASKGPSPQAVCALDTRRSRYKGLAKTHLQQILTATAINPLRAFAWIEETPLAKTRRSPFAAQRTVYEFSHKSRAEAISPTASGQGEPSTRILFAQKRQQRCPGPAHPNYAIPRTE